MNAFPLSLVGHAPRTNLNSVELRILTWMSSKATSKPQQMWVEVVRRYGSL